MIQQLPLVQATRPRPALILIALFVGATWLLANISVPVEAGPRWPAEGDIYAVDGWTVGPATVDTSRPGLAMITHQYTRERTRATVVITTSPNAKAIFRAGAAVPFLGNGYQIEAAPADLVKEAGSREAFVARRGAEAWLQLSIYGERRGQLGNGVTGWALSIFDAQLGRPNDYYLARVVVPFDERDRSATQASVALADTLFPRLAGYYGG
jgi:hypothetical protein